MTARIPAWLVVAHGLLISGRSIATGELTQEEFWQTCYRAPGQSGSKASLSESAKLLAAHGKFFSYEHAPVGPDTFHLRTTSRRIRFGPGMGLVLGIAIGSESIRAALVDANGWLLDAQGVDVGESPEGTVPHSVWHAAEMNPEARQLEEPPAMLMERLALVARAVCLRAMRDPRLLVNDALPLLGIASAWPAPVGRAKEVNGSSLPHWQWHGDTAPNLAERVALRLRLDPTRVHAVNDANALAVAVAFDDVRRSPEARTRSILALRIGGGLGAGTCVIGKTSEGAPRSMFLATRLIEGEGGYAGELGHLPVANQDLEEVNAFPSEVGLAPMPILRCSCGRAEPCLQTFASATAFVERMASSGIGIDGLADGDRRHRTSIMHAAVRDARDPRQRRAKRDIGRMIGRALASPMLMLNPSLIAIGGSMAVPEVLAGITDERRRWEDPHGEELRLIAVGQDPEPDPSKRTGQDTDANKYASVRGASLLVHRGQSFRRFETFTPPFHGLTVQLSRAAVNAWAKSPNPRS